MLGKSLLLLLSLLLSLLLLLILDFKVNGFFLKRKLPFSLPPFLHRLLLLETLSYCVAPIGLELPIPLPQHFK